MNYGRDNTKVSSVLLIGVPRKEEKKNRVEKSFENIIE